mmetsp:Transcript_37644/g.103915  ORF Transcript_37644/g.103915 Transcript_37644/m.103915 type:complete len:350 (-) Transcript_37644:11-1060(-)
MPCGERCGSIVSATKNLDLPNAAWFSVAMCSPKAASELPSGWRHRAPRSWTAAMRCCVPIANPPACANRSCAHTAILSRASRHTALMIHVMGRLPVARVGPLVFCAASGKVPTRYRRRYRRYIARKAFATTDHGATAPVFDARGDRACSRERAQPARRTRNAAAVGEHPAGRRLAARRHAAAAAQGNTESGNQARAGRRRQGCRQGGARRRRRGPRRQRHGGRPRVAATCGHRCCCREAAGGCNRLRHRARAHRRRGSDHCARGAQRGAAGARAGRRTADRAAGLAAARLRCAAGLQHGARQPALRAEPGGAVRKGRGGAARLPAADRTAGAGNGRRGQGGAAQGQGAR